MGCRLSWGKGGSWEEDSWENSRVLFIGEIREGSCDKIGFGDRSEGSLGVTLVISGRQPVRKGRKNSRDKISDLVGQGKGSDFMAQAAYPVSNPWARAGGDTREHLTPAILKCVPWNRTPENVLPGKGTSPPPSTGRGSQ